MKKIEVAEDDRKEEINQQTDEKPQNNVFDTQEIQIEELAIDGICGVY